MAEDIRRSPAFAAEEIASLLDGLRLSSHAARVRAMRRFEVYVATERPEIFDDDVDVLFAGMASGAEGHHTHDGAPQVGLCSACGMLSSKHTGGLKRSAATAIQLVRFLLRVDLDNTGSDATTTDQPRGAGRGAGGAGRSAATAAPPPAVSEGNNIFLDRFVELPLGVLKRPVTRAVFLHACPVGAGGSVTSAHVAAAAATCADVADPPPVMFTVGIR